MIKLCNIYYIELNNNKYVYKIYTKDNNIVVETTSNINKARTFTTQQKKTMLNILNNQNFKAKELRF